jgi:hypothetical protein
LDKKNGLIPVLFDAVFKVLDAVIVSIVLILYSFILDYLVHLLVYIRFGTGSVDRDIRVVSV